MLRKTKSIAQITVAMNNEIQIKALLEDAKKSDTNSAWALLKIGNERAVLGLFQIYDDCWTTDFREKRIDEALSDALVKIGKPAVPLIIQNLYSERYSPKQLCLDRVLLEIGSDAKEFCVKEWLFGKRNIVLRDVLKEFNWTPESPKDKILFFIETSQWDMITDEKDIAVPILVEKWEKTWDLVEKKSISRILYKFGWEPEPINYKISFYTETEQWGKLSKIGEPAIDVLCRSKKWDELVKIGKSAIPSLLRHANENDEALYALSKIGQEAIPVLVNEWRQGIWLQKRFSTILNQLGWKPEKIEEKVTLLFYTNQWNELVKIGDAAIPTLVKVWQSNRHSENKMDIARTLFKLGWNPPTLETKLEFFYDAILYNKLVEIGEPAVEFLFKHKLHGELAAIGKAGMPALLMLFRDPKNYAIRSDIADDILRVQWIPQNDEDKITYYLIHKNWDELVKLGKPIIPRLIKEMNVNYGYLKENAALALEKFGDKSIKSLYDFLKKVNEESRDTDLSYDKIAWLQNRITNILLQIGSTRAIISILKVFPELIINKNTEDLALKLNATFSNLKIRIVFAKNRMIRILTKKFRNGYKYGKILMALGVQNSKIVMIYVELLKDLERPSDYQEILDFFVKNNSRQAVDALFSIVSIPKYGEERFYKAIISTIGKIGDKNSIPHLRRLLKSNWAVLNHAGKVDKYVDSKWIEFEIQSAITDIQKKNE